jgi:hypothetical protein
VSEVLTVSNIRAMMMEAADTSEMPVNLYQTTRRNIPEDSNFIAYYLLRNGKAMQTICF